MTVFLRAVGCLAAAAAAGGNAAVPKVAFTAGYNNSNCEAHPHAGVELADGGWLMVGDSVCWDGSAAYDRAVFVVATERDGTERWTRVLGDRALFGDRAVGADPETLFHVALNVSDKFQPMQGMRVFHGHGASDGSVVVSAASSTGPFDENYGFHFSAMAVDDATGALKWARIYEAGLHASHPYALVLSPAGDVVIAGLAVPSANDDFYNPVGRLLKARGGDGAQVFDARQKDRETRDYNVECYGVDNAPAGGFVVTCGNGPEAPPKWMDCHEAAWDAYLYETDADGKRWGFLYIC
ncbi:hypothetical protein JL721_4083 [Aureococcus anophagefferens]|nr:hypothetical protein JL721_4083 [Aureococcus anophagefferens]